MNFELISQEDEDDLLKKSKRSEINPDHRWDGKSKTKRKDAAKKAANTKRRIKLERIKEEGVAKKKRILLVVDERLLRDFEASRKKAVDDSVTAGIRRAMQDYILKYPTNSQKTVLQARFVLSASCRYDVGKNGSFLHFLERNGGFELSNTFQIIENT